MTKLVVTLDHAFETGPLYARNDKSGAIEQIGREQAIESGTLAIHNGELELYVSTFERDQMGFLSRQINFVFLSKSKKKKSQFDVEWSGIGRGFIAKLVGDFDVAIRGGVADRLMPLGDQLDLRIEGLSHKGGVWNGFHSFIKGYNEEEVEERTSQFNTAVSLFPSIKNFKFK